MKFLANENFPLKSVLHLKEKGFDVVAIGLDHPGITDSSIMALAVEEQRTILTFDRDYGELIFKHHYKPPQGVIYLRLEEYEADQPGKLIEELVKSGEIDVEKALTVIDKDGIRQRKYD